MLCIMKGVVKVKRRYKIALCAAIPLLFVGIFGVGLFLRPAHFAKADGTGAQTACDQKGNAATYQIASGASVTVWKCPLVNIGQPYCLHERPKPDTASNYIECMPYSASSTLLIACQTHGQSINGSTIWDEVANTDTATNILYPFLFVSDEFMMTMNNGTPSPVIKDCSTLPEGAGLYPLTNGPGPTALAGVTPIA